MSEEQNGLPPGWAAASLGDITLKKVSQGGPTGESFRYIDIGSVDREAKTIGTVEPQPSASAPSRARQSVLAGDVLVSMTRPNLNAVAVVPTDLDGAIASTGFDVLRSIEVVPEWVFAHVRSRTFVDEMTRLVQGALYPAVKSGDVRSSLLPVPPLNEQKRIVAKIEALQLRSEAAKEALDAIPPLLEKFRQSVLAAAFRGDLTKAWRAQNPDVEPASELLKRIRAERRRRWEEANPRKKYKEPEPVDAEGLPELPEGWCWAWLSDCGEVSRGKSKHRPRNDARLFGNDYPFIQTGEVARSTGRISTASKFYSEFGLAQSRLFPVGTVCITIAANIADSAVLDIEACFPDSVVGVIPDAGLLPSELIEFYIRTVRDDLDAVAPATAQKNINLAVLSQVAVPVPPASEQEALLLAISESLESVLSLDDAHGSSSDLMGKLNQSILAKAFRGELVPQDPNDEPATVLLERIRAARRRTATGRRRTTRQ